MRSKNCSSCVGLGERHAVELGLERAGHEVDRPELRGAAAPVVDLVDGPQMPDAQSLLRNRAEA
jgi:hypothetical protein